MKRETYVAARTRILAHLSGEGWTVKPTLKVPQACRRDLPSLYFHAQAVYLGVHSLWIDIRGMSGVDFVAAVTRRASHGS